MTVDNGMTGPATPATPYSCVKIRTGALVFCGEDVALIRRDRPTGSHYTVPGGNVHPGEDLLEALAREMAEELRLELTDATPPELCWIQDQMVTRPGPTPPPRKLHMIFRCHIAPEVRAASPQWSMMNCRTAAPSWESSSGCPTAGPSICPCSRSSGGQ
ncbi:NUDIX hydrolase [Nonomuraea thailandensis]